MTGLESGSPPPDDGAEQQAAKILNGVMILLLALGVAGFASWSMFDFLRSVSSADPSVSWQTDGVLRFLIPLSLLSLAVSMARWSLRMPKRGSK